jgi:nucleoside-diphosphate-sugar epimerase
VSERGHFEGRRAVVTGACGFIGGALCAALAEAGAEVTGLDLDPTGATGLEAAGARFARCDVTDPEATSEALAGAELVIHAAAFVREWGSMEEFVALNLGGTANVLDAADEHGVKRVVHLSSVVVYGYDDPTEQDESAPLRTTGNPYIDTKASSDRLAQRRGAVVIRPGDVYGPGSVPWTIRPLELARKNRLIVPAPGDGVMLPVYISDLVEAVLLGAESGSPGEAYTAWSGERITFKQYFDGLAALAGARCRVLPRRLLETAGRASERVARARGTAPEFTDRAVTFLDRRGTVSNRRIVTELGFEPQVEVPRGLELTEAWARREGLL